MSNKKTLIDKILEHFGYIHKRNLKERLLKEYRAGVLGRGTAPYSVMFIYNAKTGEKDYAYCDSKFKTAREWPICSDGRGIFHNVYFKKNKRYTIKICDENHEEIYTVSDVCMSHPFSFAQVPWKNKL